jgi:outer membrane protein assembly factor BamB
MTAIQPEAPVNGPARLLYRTASALCVVALVFAVILSTLLLVNYVQVKRTDPLNNPALAALREQFTRDGDNAALKAEIRALDLLARQAFFTSQAQLRVGGILLVSAVLVLVIALNVVTSLREKTPDPMGCPGLDSAWATVFAKRRAITLTGAALLVGAFVAGLTSQSLLNETSIAAYSPPAPEGDAAVSGAAPPAPPVGLPKAPSTMRSASFRGLHGSGFSQHRDVPTRWNEANGTGVLWKAPIPRLGLSSPIVWGDFVFLSGATREHREVYCYHADDGRLLWSGSYTSAPHAPTAYEVFDAPEALMYAVSTPATDGQQVYALFANGELAAFEAATGRAVWSVVLGDPTDNAYGLSGSLIPFGNGVIAQFDGDRNTLARYDGATGRRQWLAERPDNTWASPILVPLASGRQAVITHGNPTTTAWEPDTGAKLWSVDLCTGDVAPSPIYADGRIFVNFAGCGIYAVRADNGAARWSVEALAEGDFSEAVSMVCDGTLLYQVEADILSVLNAEDGSIVYEQKLPHAVGYASPFIVGKRLYLICGKHVLVAATGPAFVVEAVNTLAEICTCSPAVVDGRIYLRTNKYLYCLGGG